MACLALGACADPSTTGTPGAPAPSPAPSSSQTPSPAGSPVVVPWADRPAPEPSYRSPSPFPPAPACRASDLSAAVERRPAAAPKLAFQVRLRNDGDRPCLLDNWAEGDLVAADGAVLDHGSSGRPSIGLPPQPPLDPGNLAVTDGFWTGWCGRDPGRWRIRLRLDAHVEVPGLDVPAPACPPSPDHAANGFGVYTILDRFERPVLDPRAAWRATLDVPGTARAGDTVSYRLTLANPTRGDLALDPCPAYAESFRRGADGTSELAATHELNCPLAPERVGPGGSVVFELRVRAPAPAGTYFLDWNFTSVGVWRYGNGDGVRSARIEVVP